MYISIKGPCLFNGAGGLDEPAPGINLELLGITNTALLRRARPD
jgi:hypothetical protein